MKFLNFSEKNTSRLMFFNTLILIVLFSHLGIKAVNAGPTNTGSGCVLKEGVNSFSVGGECGSGKYRYMTFACYDGYTKKEGGPTSCKTSDLWRSYAEESCKGHTNGCLAASPTPTPSAMTSGSFLSLVYLGKTVYNVGDTFGVIAKVNSVGNKIDGVDGVVNYDGGLLSLISIKKMPSMVFTGLGGDCAISQGVSNKVSFTCYLNDSMKSAAVNGDLVMMVFGVKSLGESKINFECGQSLTTESNIVSYGIDIIDCSKNQNLVINMNNGGSTLPSSESNGKCGTKRNSCNVGKVNDDALPDTKNEYRWKCMGVNGGKNVNCSLGKKVDGKCGSKKNTCSSGTVSKVSDSSSQYKWKCVGRYGGKTVNCSVRK